VATLLDSTAHAIPFTTTRVVAGLSNPLYVTAAPGDTARLFIVEGYTGHIKILNLQTLVVKAQPFHTQTDIVASGEQGLLGLAFHPAYPDSPYFYVNFTRAPDGISVIRRYSISANPDSADPTSGVDLITVPRNEGPNHNAGWLGFGPDGHLYIPLGDKGDGNYVVSQSDTTRQGKVLRIDVDGGFPYAIPPDNPFASDPSPKNEFWAYGLRNPWRPSFDRATGDFYIADVGQGKWEEIDYQPASSAGSENYGWAKMEGHIITPVCPLPCDTSGLTLPIHDYPHAATPSNCSITGGYVYRGSAIPNLQGLYFFADFCSHQIWTLRVVDGAATEVTNRTVELAPGGGLTIEWISSFGEDANGELYVCDFYGGEVFKIIPYPTSVESPDLAPEAPFALGVPSPNPSDRGFAFEVRLAELGGSRVRVYDASGRLVRTVWDGVLTPGTHVLAWDGRDSRGLPVASGVYAVSLETGDGAQARKVSIMR
jgi:glucose/arabinose dehydrogenase